MTLTTVIVIIYNLLFSKHASLLLRYPDEAAQMIDKDIGY